MKSINTKFIKIILASVLMTTIIITSFFIYFSKRALKLDAYEKLNSEAENIKTLFTSSEDIIDVRLQIESRRIFSNLLMANRLILIDEDKNYITLTNNEEINKLNISIVEEIAPELTEMEKYISFSIEGIENLGIAYQFNFIIRMETFPGYIKVGWIYLYVPVEEIKLSQVVLRSFFFALLISMIISTAISIFFGRKMMKPLGQLAIYSKKISERKFSDVRKIKTGDEFEELSNEFIKMADKLKLYDNKQKEFFQNASHNLKTPLMSIRGYAEAILDGVTDDKEKALGIIIEETDKLAELVKKILFISKSESVEEFYRFEVSSVRDIIQETAKKMIGIMNEKGISLNLDIDDMLYISADREKMVNAVSNILSNSLRYARSMVKIRAYGNDDYVVISIEDDGEGFDQEEEELIFERFYKGKKGNFGLGLAITKMIIDKHDGNIKAYNINNGACVEIILKRCKDVPDKTGADI